MAAFFLHILYQGRCAAVIRRHPVSNDGVPVERAAIENWHRADVVAAVRKRGSSLAAIAKDHGLSRQTLYWALTKPHRRANNAIAAFLDLSLHQLWPQWFDRAGECKTETRTQARRRRLQPQRKAA